MYSVSSKYRGDSVQKALSRFFFYANYNNRFSELWRKNRLRVTKSTDRIFQRILVYSAWNEYSWLHRIG